MKRKSFLLLGLCVVLIVCLGIGGVLTWNTERTNRDSKSFSYDQFSERDTDDTYDVTFSGGEFDYKLSIGEDISVQDLLKSFQLDMNNVDFSTLKLVSNENEAVIQYDTQDNKLTAVSEGEDKITFNLNNENVILNMVVSSVKTSNAVIGNYTFTASTSPRYTVTITNGKMMLKVWDGTGINTNDIELYSVDANRNNLKKLSFSINNISTNSKKNNKYECYITDSNVLVNGKNYFHLIVKDMSGFTTDGYFVVESTNGSYIRNFPPKVNTFKFVDEKTISFVVKDSGKISSLVVYDKNNNNKVVLTKNNIVTSTIELSLNALELSSNKRYNISVAVTDNNGNYMIRDFKLNITSKGSPSSGDAKQYKVLINPSHQIYNSTVDKKNAKHKNERESMYTFSEYVVNELKSRGYLVYRSKKEDGTTRLNKNVQIKPLIKESGASKEKVIYLALHSNASGGKRIGPVVYYYNKSSNSKNFGSKLCSSLTDVYIDRWSGYSSLLKKKSSTIPNCLNTSGSVAEPKYFYGLGGKGAAALIEIGYHDRKDNEKFIQNNMQNLAVGIADAIDSYLGKDDSITLAN